MQVDESVGQECLNRLGQFFLHVSNRYDGSFEKKTEAEYKRDMFLYKQDVKPVTERLKVVTLACGALWVASCVGLKASYSLKPVFNE